MQTQFTLGSKLIQSVSKIVKILQVGINHLLSMASKIMFLFSLLHCSLSLTDPTFSYLHQRNINIYCSLKYIQFWVAGCSLQKHWLFNCEFNTCYIVWEITEYFVLFYDIKILERDKDQNMWISKFS